MSYKTLVIAENSLEAGFYAGRMARIFSSLLFLAKDSLSTLRILKGHKGIDFVCVGNWKKRKDLKEIFEQLYLCNVGTELEAKTNVYRVLYG